MTQAELIDAVQLELIALSSEFEEALYTQAYSDACADTGFVCPETDEFRIKWLKARLKRWLFAYKLDSSLENFDVPKAQLNQIVKNYTDRIKEMDEEFMLVKLENPVNFGLATTKGGMFGHVVGSGFINDGVTGEDISYESTGNVIINGE